MSSLCELRLHLEQEKKISSSSILQVLVSKLCPSAGTWGGNNKKKPTSASTIHIKYTCDYVGYFFNLCMIKNLLVLIPRELIRSLLNRCSFVNYRR